MDSSSPASRRPRRTSPPSRRRRATIAPSATTDDALLRRAAGRSGRHEHVTQRQFSRDEARSLMTDSPRVRRREFLKVLGAASATTATIGCSQEQVEKLIPYVVSPDNTVPGVSSYYASTCRECAAG